MSFPEKYGNKYCFHFTHIENLESIVRNGLLCTNRKTAAKIDHTNIAAESIQERRHDMDVTCMPGKKVHDFVPFYLCTVNPMLLALLNSKNIDQPCLVFFAIGLKKLENRTDIAFCDASANTNVPPNFYNDVSHLDKLDWPEIGKRAWSKGSPDEMHRRMAEVFFEGAVPIQFIDAIIVWNESVRDAVINVFKNCGVEPPQISYSPFKGYHFFFTKFMAGKEYLNHSLITGPGSLKGLFKGTIKRVRAKRAAFNGSEKFQFQNIEEAVKVIGNKFTAIKELEGIYELKTDNSMHAENVSDHTKKVVEELEKLEYYKKSGQNDQAILKLSAFLHDIGKGPKTRWKDEIQPSYPDHPADAPPMLERILVEEIADLSDYEIRKICLLVTYHDLIGEIMFKGRHEQQLVDIIEDEHELDMLDALNLADVSAINRFWKMRYNRGIGNFKANILAKLEEV